MLAQNGEGVMPRMKKDGMPAKPPVEFTAERKQQFLDLFRSRRYGGRMYLCAEMVGVTSRTIQAHRKFDPEFNYAYEEAEQAWIDETLVTPLIDRAVDGVERPIVGGRWKDEIVATERIYSDGLLTTALRSRRVEYRDSAAASAQIGSIGGIMIIPTSPAAASDWQEQFGEMSRGGHVTIPKDKR